MRNARISPTVISYNAAVSACEKGGQWQQALFLLQTMPKANLRIDVISYSAAISACEKGGQWQQSVTLFEKMLSVTVQHLTVIQWLTVGGIA
jgi:pentatricopeptide repeat domain-containing protein 1